MLTEHYKDICPQCGFIHAECEVDPFDTFKCISCTMCGYWLWEDEESGRRQRDEARGMGTITVYTHHEPPRTERFRDPEHRQELINRMQSIPDEDLIAAEITLGGSDGVFHRIFLKEVASQDTLSNSTDRPRISLEEPRTYCWKEDDLPF